MHPLDPLRREEFPLSANSLYFNHASISPIPRRAQEKMKWSTDRLAEQPSHHFMRDGLPMMMAFHQEVAALLNAASPKEIVPITSTSAGLNAIAQALPLQAGDHIAFADEEFPSNAYPWMSLERDGVVVDLVPARHGGLTLEALLPHITPQTRVVAASAVQFFSGHRTDLAAIGAFCRERGIWFVVDAIQAAGHMAIDVQAMKIDVLAAGGQKSLMAPPGIGFMYVREDLAAQMRPRLIGPNATRNWLFWLDYDLEPEEGAARFMAGTPNVVGMFGLLESLSLLRELGLENIDQHTTLLAEAAITGLAGLGYEPVTQREEHGPIATFRSGRNSEETDHLVSYLDQQGASITKHLSKSGEAHLRLSFHCYNTEDEVQRFLEIIKGYTP